MKPGNLIALIIIAIFTIAVLVVGGQYAGGIFVLKRFALDVNTVSYDTLYSYYVAYGHLDNTVGNMIKIGLAISAAPVVLMFVFIIALFVTRKGAIEDLYGDARFATAAEIARAGMFYDEKKDTKWPPVLLGKKGKRYIADYSQEYTTLAAPPGAGKGVSFVVPNLLTYPHSVINFDPKTENFAITAGYRHSVLGQDVYLFSPDNIDRQTHCWNPLDYISMDPLQMLADIKTVTTILIPAPDGQNQSFFISARSALDGILLYLMESPDEERTCYNAYTINEAAIGIDKWVISNIARREKSGSPLSEDCKRMLLSYANESEKKRDTTKGIISTYLNVFSDQLCRAATNKSDFNFNDLRKKPMTIYVGITPPNVSKYQRLLNLFFSQALSVNTYVLPEEGPKDDDGEPILKYQCLPLLDEFAALGAIDIIQSSSGYTRAYNMRYAAIFQNRAQIYSDKCYGQTGGEALLETFHNEIVFATESVRDAEEYSKRLGTVTLKHKERNRSRNTGGSGGSVSYNTQRHSRALMLPQEIQRLPYTEQLIFKKGGRIHPIHCNKIVWYEDPNFKQKANLPTPAIPNMEFQR